MNPWAFSALWAGFSLIATLLAIWSKLLTALSVIAIGIITEPAIRIIHGTVGLRSNTQWIVFLVYAEAIAPVFFAWTELKPILFRSERNATIPSRSARLCGPEGGAVVAQEFVNSCVGAQMSSQRSALVPGKRNHYV